MLHPPSPGSLTDKQTDMGENIKEAIKKKNDNGLVYLRGVIFSASYFEHQDRDGDTHEHSSSQ